MQSKWRILHLQISNDVSLSKNKKLELFNDFFIESWSG